MLTLIRVRIYPNLGGLRFDAASYSFSVNLVVRKCGVFHERLLLMEETEIQVFNS